MINAIWRARLIRLWLVVGVPLACWSAYEAWDAFQSINVWNDQIEYWRARWAEQERTGVNNGMLDPYKQLMESIDYKTESVERANIMTVIAAVLVAMPVIGAIILKAADFVWAGPPISSNIEKSAASFKSWREVLLSKRAKWIFGAGGILLFTAIMYALRPEITTTTLIQVGIQVGVLGAVLAVIKFFRR